MQKYPRGLTIETSYRAMSNVSLTPTATTDSHHQQVQPHVKRSQAVGFCQWAGRESGEERERDFIWEMFVAGNKDKDRRARVGAGQGRVKACCAWWSESCVVTLRDTQRHQARYVIPQLSQLAGCSHNWVIQNSPRYDRLAGAGAGAGSN